MNPKFWLTVAFLMSRIGLFEAAAQCRTAAEYSIRGMFLRGYTFKTCTVGWSESCYFRCAEEVTCQSYNFVIGQKVCELNNRTKEARPEDFMPDPTRFYMKRANNRGTPQFYFSCCIIWNSPMWPAILENYSYVVRPCSSCQSMCFIYLSRE